MRVLFIDQSAQVDTVDDIHTRPLGGRVGSLFHLPDALCRLGYDCTVFADIKMPGVTEAGTQWTNSVPTDTDVLVLYRGIGHGWPQVRAKSRVFVPRDLPHSGFAPRPRVLKAFNRVVFLSKYAEDVWRTFYKPIGKSVIIPNGVDRRRFKPNGVKHLNKIIYISAPNRGLKRLPLIFEALRSRVGRNLEMVALSNMATLHPGEIEEKSKDGFALDYKSCQGAGIRLVAPQPSEGLATELGSAGLMLLPTGYPEICSNAVLQALSCGVPVVTTGNLGATPEWVRHGHNGMLTKWRPEDYMVHTVEMTRLALKVLTNRGLHKRLIVNAPNTKNVLDWSEIGKKWHKMLRRLS